jgi:hypothetical protein
MAQASVGRSWQKTQATTPRVGRRPVAPDALPQERRYAGWYVWLGIIIAASMAYVGLCATAGELGSVKYRLQQQVDAEKARRADMVRQINMLGTYGNLQPTAGADDLTDQPAGVLKVKAARALPPEKLTVLSTPQPYVAHAPASTEGGTSTGPALAGTYAP